MEVKGIPFFFRKFKLIKPENRSALIELLNEKQLSYKDVMMIVQTIANKDKKSTEKDNLQNSYPEVKLGLYELYKMPWYKKMKKFSSITYLFLGNRRVSAICSAGLFTEAKGNPDYENYITEHGDAHGDHMIPKAYNQRETMLETRVYYSRIWYEDKREGAEIKHVLIDPFGRCRELEFEDSFVLSEEK